MLYGKRLFPYPVLNSDRSLSQFRHSSFSGYFEKDSDEECLILSNVHYDLTNGTIESLIDEGKAECVLYIECSGSRYRRIFKLGKESKTIRIPLAILNGQIQICFYIFALADIKPYSPDDIDEIYGEFRDFDVEKYDVLAIDECYRFRIAFDVDDDNIASSIFDVVGNPDILDDSLDIQVGDRKIEINLSTETYNKYNGFKGSADYKWLPFAAMLVPALCHAFELVKSEPGNTAIEDLERNYRWFMSVEARFEKVFARKLTYEEFREKPSYVLAQSLLDYPLSKAIRCSYELIRNGGSEDDE